MTGAQHYNYKQHQAGKANCQLLQSGDGVHRAVGGLHVMVSAVAHSLFGMYRQQAPMHAATW